MKKILMIIIAAFAVVLMGCVKNLDTIGLTTKTTYKGRVIEKSQNLPISGVNVSVGDGSHVHVSSVTDSNGKFEMMVDFEELNDQYLLHLDCQGYPSITEELKGMGQDVYDYKDIIFFDNENSTNWPVVMTNDVTNITSSSAKSGGKIVYTGEASITERGVCWSINHDPSIEDDHSNDGSGSGSFTSNMTNLTLNTTYYVRAYATNRHGTYYGEEKSFKTTNGRPTVVLDENSFVYVSATSLRCSSSVTSDGGFSVTERGVCWSIYSMPTTNDNHTTDGLGIGDYNSTLTGLNSSNTYYIRAYATNSKGTSYSEQFILTSEHFTYFTLPRIQYYGDTYVVYPDMGNKASWMGAANFCSNLNYAGYSDWFLPEDDMLDYMYINKNTIGGFLSEGYWSNTPFADPNYGYDDNQRYYVDFANGYGGYEYIFITPGYRVRPVRKVTGK